MATIGNIGRYAAGWIRSQFNTSTGITRQQYWNNVFNYALQLHAQNVDLGYEIPTYMLKSDRNSVVPLDILPVSETGFQRRTSDIIFRDAYGYLVTESIKGERYYAGKGVILDKDRIPLMLVTAIIDNLCIKKIKIYVNPKILTAPQITLNKYILTQILPFYINGNGKITINSGIILESTENRSITLTPEVEVSNRIYEFFAKPEEPQTDLAEEGRKELNDELERKLQECDLL